MSNQVIYGKTIADAAANGSLYTREMFNSTVIIGPLMRRRSSTPGDLIIRVACKRCFIKLPLVANSSASITLRLVENTLMYAETS